MKKMTLATATLTALIAASTTTSVFATDTKIDALNHTSNGHVVVTSDDDPDKGGLQLVAVPDLEFGEITLGSAAKAVETDSNAVTTSDLRGTKDGWNLVVKYVTTDGKETTDADAWVGANGAKGAGFQLKLPALAYGAQDGETNVGEKPVGTAIDSVNYQDSPVASADGATMAGKGVWTGSFAKADTTITVPVNNQKDDYTSTLLWTLASVPAA